jgi:hypothetical protein
MVVFGACRSHISRLRPSAGPHGISTSLLRAVQYSPTAALNSACRVFAISVMVGTSRGFFAREGFAFVPVLVSVPVNVCVSVLRWLCVRSASAVREEFVRSAPLFRFSYTLRASSHSAKSTSLRQRPDISTNLRRIRGPYSAQSSSPRRDSVARSMGSLGTQQSADCQHEHRRFR